MVYDFNKKRDGTEPVAGLTLVRGVLYGTTAFGGTRNRGTIYALTTSGTERVLYSFKGVNGTIDGSTTDGDGWRPDSTLVEVKHILYGTTRIGGTPGSICGCGTVFSFNLATNQESVIYRFLGHSDGEEPSALIAASGNLYGMTTSGGTNGCALDQGCGTVFEISGSGAKRTLYSFQGGTDGAEPTSLVALNGSLYGVTWEGGGTNCTNETQVVGCGTIFEIDASGSEHIVYSFQGQPDAAFPNDLIDVSGTLYGASTGGGVHNRGTIFEVGETGQASLLYSFGAPHGKRPYDLLAVHGALYGTAGGGVSGCFTSSSFDPGHAALYSAFSPDTEQLIGKPVSMNYFDRCRTALSFVFAAQCSQGAADRSCRSALQARFARRNTPRWTLGRAYTANNILEPSHDCCLSHCSHRGIHRLSMDLAALGTSVGDMVVPHWRPWPLVSRCRQKPLLAL